MELVPKILSWVGYALCIGSIIGLLRFGYIIKEGGVIHDEKDADRLWSFFQFLSIISVLIAIFGLLMAWHFGSM